MANNLESLVSRFLATMGLVEQSGYRTIEVLVDEREKPFLGGRENLKLAFSPEAVHEHPGAELVTYGSAFLDTMAEAATARGNTLHLYLNGLNPTTGRTLEKVQGQKHIPGHLVERGEEQLLLFHHAIFRFKVALIGEEREEFFFDIAVDLHTGWSTLNMDAQSLLLYVSGEQSVRKELNLRLSLGQAYQAAIRELDIEMSPQIKDHQDDLKISLRSEQQQVTGHYQSLLTKLEAGKNHKGADTERLDAKIRATRADLVLRLQDLEKRYRLGKEINLKQLALVSYPKAVVPLRIQQGKEIHSNIAIWDSLTRQGYIADLTNVE